MMNPAFLAMFASALGSSSPPAAPSVTITPTAKQAGVGIFTCNASSAGASSYEYQWTNAGVDIPGATSQTYSDPGTFGSNAINCRVVAVNGVGDSDPASAASNALLRWAGLVAVNGSTSTADLAMDFGTVMPGQVNWLLLIAVSPSGNITWEGVGPSALASHASFRASASAAGNRTGYLFSNQSADAVQNVIFSATMSARTVWGFRTVGYDVAPAAFVSAGNAASNQASATANLAVAANGAVLAGAQGYDGLPNPAGLVNFATGRGSPFEGSGGFTKWTGGGDYAAGVGQFAAANSSLGVQATRSGAAVTSKHVSAASLTPLAA